MQCQRVIKNAKRYLLFSVDELYDVDINQCFFYGDDIEKRNEQKSTFFMDIQKTAPSCEWRRKIIIQPFAYLNDEHPYISHYLRRKK